VAEQDWEGHGAIVERDRAAEDRLLVFADMPSTTRARVLGCPVDVLDMDGAVARLLELTSAPAPDHAALVVTLNPEILMRARREPDFHSILESAELIVPDGVGLVRALRRRGHRKAVRVGGIDLLAAYLPRAVERGHTIALVGARDGVARAAAAVLAARHPGLDVIADSGDPTADTATRVGSHAPNLVAAAYGAERQERFLRDHLPTMHASAGIGVGGTLDYIAGVARRAPALVRRAGFEWLWRLVHEPRRWRRQAVLPVFWWLERREVRR
jgi:N-acetylglucosaminyldiphosphoundecaprenol N-acetyl-beta-D-mannosaminyltransferase